MLTQMLGLEPEQIEAAGAFARGFLDRVASHLDRSYLQNVKVQRSLDILADVLLELNASLKTEHEYVKRQLNRAVSPKKVKK
jgi:hypothetical protein